MSSTARTGRVAYAQHPWVKGGRERKKVLWEMGGRLYFNGTMQDLSLGWAATLCVCAPSLPLSVRARLPACGPCHVRTVRTRTGDDRCAPGSVSRRSMTRTVRNFNSTRVRPSSRVRSPAVPCT